MDGIIQTQDRKGTIHLSNKNLETLEVIQMQIDQERSLKAENIMGQLECVE